MKGRAILAVGLLLLAGCQTRAVRTDALRTDLGALYVYLHPLPPASVRLRLVLAGAVAVRAEGETIPLELHVRDVDGRTVGRQRLLAAGRVPPGSYQGIALTVQGAWLRGEEGEAALLNPKAPVFVAAPFKVGREGAALVEVSYPREGAMRQGFRLEPEFVAYAPAKPVFSKVGYAASSGGGHLAVFDRSALEVVSAIGTGRGASAIAVDERERRAYVALSGEDAVDVVDIPAGQVIARIRLQAGDRPESLALAPNGVLLCANRDSNTVSVIDGRSFLEIDRIPVGNDPRHVLVDGLGRKAYVFNTRSDSISVIDVGRRVVVASVKTEAGPLRGAINRTSDRLYVIHADSPYVAVFDPGTLAPAGRIRVGMGARALLVDRNTDMIYLGKHGSGIVDIYDPFSLLPADFIDLPGSPSEMLIDREENRILFALPERDAVVAVDLVTKRIRAVMDVAGSPRSLGIMGAQR